MVRTRMAMAINVLVLLACSIFTGLASNEHINNIQMILDAYTFNILDSDKDLDQLRDKEIVVIVDDSGSMVSDDQKDQGTGNVPFEDLTKTLGIISLIGNNYDTDGIDVFTMNYVPREVAVTSKFDGHHFQMTVGELESVAERDVPKQVTIRSINSHDRVDPSVPAMTLDEWMRVVDRAIAEDWMTPLVATVATVCHKMEARLKDSSKKVLLIIISDGTPYLLKQGGHEDPTENLESLLHVLRKFQKNERYYISLASLGLQDWGETILKKQKDFPRTDVTRHFPKEKELVLSNGAKKFERPDWALKILLGPIDDRIGNLDRSRNSLMLPWWWWVSFAMILVALIAILIWYLRCYRKTAPSQKELELSMARKAFSSTDDIEICPTNSNFDEAWTGEPVGGEVSMTLPRHDETETPFIVPTVSTWTKACPQEDDNIDDIFHFEATPIDAKEVVQSRKSRCAVDVEADYVEICASMALQEDTTTSNIVPLETALLDFGTRSSRKHAPRDQVDAMGMSVSSVETERKTPRAKFAELSAASERKTPREKFAELSAASSKLSNPTGDDGNAPLDTGNGSVNNNVMTDDSPENNNITAPSGTSSVMPNTDEIGLSVPTMTGDKGMRNDDRAPLNTWNVSVNSNFMTDDTSENNNIASPSGTSSIMPTTDQNGPLVIHAEGA